jgi:hypothetical protein
MYTVWFLATGRNEAEDLHSADNSTVQNRVVTAEPTGLNFR